MSDDMRKIFQDNLNYYMAVKKISQQDIVNALGVSKSTVSDWCHGKNYPRIDVMQALSDYLGVLMNRLTLSNSHEDELSDDERHLIALFRGAESSARQIAIETLANHQEKDTSSRTGFSISKIG